MGFWTVVFAYVVGRFIYEFLDAILGEVVEQIKNTKNERRIGFGSSAESVKKAAKGAQMRRIGFGEHD